MTRIAATPAQGASGTAAAPFSSLRSYRLEAKYEFLRLLRTPMFSIPVLAFPALFYLLFGVVMNGGSPQAAQYLLATYGVFGVMGAALFGFGVTVAMEREQGLLKLKRVQPMPPGAYLLAKMAMAMLFSALVSILVAVLAFALANVALRPSQWALLVVVDVVGALPFCALGLYIGTLANGSGAPVVINLLYLPMAFLSGLWLPLQMLPEVIARLAPAWPSYHLAQLALKVVGMDAGGHVALHVGVLAVLAVAFFVLARARLARAG
jgi:ABC-2 type transport system permease protein